MLKKDRKVGKAPSRVPPSVDGLQINACRNLACPNFGKPPFQKVGRGLYGKKDGYRISGGWKPHVYRMLYCTLCGESLTLKSNHAVMEELDRLWKPLIPPAGPACKNKMCPNYCVSVDCAPAEYQRFGKTAIGSPRYRCKHCQKTFSITSNPTHRQRKPEKNDLIFRALINKVPMRRICELIEIQPAVLYQRLKFIQEQCHRFSRSFEQALIDGKHIDELHLTVDRQEYVLNWGTQFNRRNTQLAAVASADNKTGYVFGMHLDYDPDVDTYEADLHAREIGDYEVDRAYRYYARIWLPEDYDLSQSVIENADISAPSNGTRVYREYTLFAHFMFLRRLLPGAEKILFFMDQESNIRAACFSAFNDWILEGKVESFLVRINKSLTIDEKRLALASREQMFSRLREDFSDSSDWRIARILMEEEYKSQLTSERKVSSRWVRHPLPNMGEPEKSVCFISDRGKHSAKEVADMMLWASMHSVDRYFMLLRRRISLLERPIATASSNRRIWHGGSPYNPEVVSRLLDSFRVAYNFSLAGKDYKTPAMRLGISDRPYSLGEILNWDG